MAENKRKSKRPSPLSLQPTTTDSTDSPDALHPTVDTSSEYVL